MSSSEEEVAKCNVENCKNNKKNGDYCGKHEKFVARDKAVKEGKKICSNISKGCVTILEKNFKYSKCDTCREKSRLKDNKAKERKQQQNVPVGSRLCSACNNIGNDDQFIGVNGGQTTECASCRDIQRKADEKRRMRT